MKTNPPYADIADFPEDERIRLIGEMAMEKRIVVGFIVDDDTVENGKADRYKKKLRERFPNIRIIITMPGPVAQTTLIKVGPPIQ